MRFSIVVPAHNEAAFLGATLRSLQRQDFRRAYEIIVVDNASTDETTAVARSYRVEVLHEPELGVCAARQRGAEAATGEYLVSVDADTLYPPTWLSAVDRTLRRAGDPVAVGGPCRYEHSPWWVGALVGLLFGLVSGLFRTTGLVGYVSAANLAVRRTAFPGYDRTLTQGGDELDLLRRLRPLGRVVWDPHLVVTTSPRRFARGLLYSLVMSLFVHYLLTYVVNRLTGRQALGVAPAYRLVAAFPVRRRGSLILRLAGVLAAGLGLITWAGPAAADALVTLWTRR